MNLIKVHPRRDLFHVDSNPFRLFDDFFTPFTGFRQLTTDITTPTVDIYDKDDKIVIDAEMPGFDKKNIHVDVKGRLLTLSGERQQDEEVKEEKSYRRERYYGKFERSFNLPYEVNPETIVAQYKKGILTLEIPKPEEQKAKQITIN